MQCVRVFTDGVALAVEALGELLDTHRAKKQQARNSRVPGPLRID
jgi:hypothetical protein